MAYQPGESGNPTGRPKGSRNKVPEQIKEMIESMLTDNAEGLQKTFKALKGKNKINAMVNLLPYVVPKLQSTSLDIDFDSLTEEQLDSIIQRLLQAGK